MSNFSHTRCGLALCLLAGALTAACDGGSEIAGVEVDTPPSARFGNIATVDLQAPGSEGVLGTAVFAQTDAGLRIETTLEGLAPGDYTLRLDERGDCASVGGADSAGGAAVEPAANLGTVTADSSGSASIVQDAPQLDLIGEDGVVGSSLVLERAGGDAASSGRVACGVIDWGSQSLTTGD